MEPSIGRIVHFFPGDRLLADAVLSVNDCRGGALAAVVTAVHSPTCVNLMVLPRSGPAPIWVTSVMAVVDFDSFEADGARTSSYWAWPPRV